MTMTSAARIKALAEQTAKAFAIDPSLAAGGGRTRVRRTAGLACEIEDGPWRLVSDVPASAGGADEGPGSLYVSGVAVTSEHRRRGLGRRLMEQARARAETLGLPRVSLICFEANEAAMQLYRRLGYVEVDRRPVVPHPCLHYSDGDALLLVRGLD